MLEAGRKTLHGAANDHKAYRRETGEIELATSAYRRFHLFKAALDGGLFAWFDENGAASAWHIVETMRWNGRYGQLFLQAMLQEGFLEQCGNRLHAALTVAQARQVGLQLREMESAWACLPGLLHASGEPGQAASLAETVWETERSRESGREQVMGVVCSWPQAGAARRLLDLGGTDAAFSIALCAAFSQLHAEVLVERGRRAVVQRAVLDAGLEQRIMLFEGDTGTLDLQGSYDVVLAAHCFYAYPQTILQAMETVAAHLRAGGLFVSQHRFEEAQTTPDDDCLVQLEGKILQTRQPLHYPAAYADRISSAGMRLQRSESGREGEHTICLHVAERIVG